MIAFVEGGGKGVGDCATSGMMGGTVEGGCFVAGRVGWGVMSAVVACVAGMGVVAVGIGVRVTTRIAVAVHLAVVGFGFGFESFADGLVMLFVVFSVLEFFGCGFYSRL